MHASPDPVPLPRPVLRSQLVAQGFDDARIRMERRSRSWTRLKRGAYVETSGIKGLSREERHRILIEAYQVVLDPGTVLSHVSAAVMHGLPLYKVDTRAVHVTRSRARSGRRRETLIVHVNPLDPAEVVEVEGLSVTSVARTILDLACAPLLATGVVLADHALREGRASIDELASLLPDLGPRHGIGRARAAVAFADGRSESPGESVSRVAMAHYRLPVPTLQSVVRDERGKEIARCDFEVEEYATVGEFDGLAKYGRWRRQGESAGDAVVREKLREDQIRDAGREVVRWVWADLAGFSSVNERWLRAFDRNKNRRS